MAHDPLDRHGMGVAGLSAWAREPFGRGLRKVQARWATTWLSSVLLMAGIASPVAVSAQTVGPSWYLMLPAPLIGWPFANYEAPLSKWNISDTFDSAGRCQVKQRLLLKEVAKYAEGAAQARQEWQAREFVRPELVQPAVLHATVSGAQCVPVGDARLALVAPAWMLLLPPHRWARPFLDVEAPLGNWFWLGVYDSHLACDVAQRGLPEQMSLGPPPGPPDSDRRWQSGPDSTFWQRLALARSQCVSATDPRLVPRLGR
jgi:hypothetical protein